jgi:macrodomain Ter protein organizer (MatP/YcbG family)
MTPPKWSAKSIDVDAALWQRAKAAAAEDGMELRQWLRRAIKQALLAQQYRRPAVLPLGRIVIGKK